MITQRMSLRTEVLYSDDLTHRYLMRKEWDKNKPKATIIMINQSSATEIEIDQTTMNVINNLNRLGYGAVDITNLCSLISPKISYRLSIEELVHEENDIQIEKSCLKSDCVIIAWGSFGEGSRKMMQRQEELLQKLSPFQDKMYVICDAYRSIPMHPLCPRVKNQWRLVKRVGGK